jgi:glycine oxidase
MPSGSRTVTVVGAGLIGATISWRLAQAGLKVTLVDAGAFGGETSSAGAGMLSPGGEFDQPPGAHSESQRCAPFNSVWSDLGVESMSLYPGFVAELRARTNVPIDFQICGCTKLPEGPGQPRHYPGDGFVDPNHLLRALRLVCLEYGVNILENQPISKLDSTDLGALVIAAGAWSNQLQITHRGRAIALPPVKPIKGHLIGFDLDPAAFDAQRLGPMFRRGHTYLLQRSGGFTIAGSTEEDVGFNRSVDPSICADLHRRAAGLWPVLETIAPSRRWIGFRPYAETPRIGRLIDTSVGGTNVWLAYGHFRNGILLAPVTAQRIANDIAAALGKPLYL